MKDNTIALALRTYADAIESSPSASVTKEIIKLMRDAADRFESIERVCEIKTQLKENGRYESETEIIH